MTFASMEEADLAFALGKIDLHAKINVRLPADSTDEDRGRQCPSPAR